MSEIERIRPFYPLIKSLYKASRKKLGFEPHPTIYVSNNLGNAKNPLGKTAHYSPSEHKIVLYTTGRHIKDILRSLSHELVHHNQNCNGKFDGGAATVVGYAQEDPHLRDMEREAYEVGNMIFRDWEDSLKKKGGKSLFTTKSNYVRPMTIDVVGGRLVEGDKQMKLTESRLREYIKETIKEMIDESLNEEEMMEAEMEEGKDDLLCEPHCKPKPAMEEELDEMKDEDAMEEGMFGDFDDDSNQLSDEEKKKKKKCQDLKDEYDKASGAVQFGNDPYADQALDMIRTKMKAACGMNEAVSEEDLNESFLPKGRDIRSSAREMTYDKLLKKWAK
jgi:hypothetical protein